MEFEHNRGNGAFLMARWMKPAGVLLVAHFRERGNFTLDVGRHYGPGAGQNCCRRAGHRRRR